MSHAILSPSSSERWLNCPPSARIAEASQDRTSPYAQEGTEAHALGEHKLKKLLGYQTKDPTASLTFYNKEMEECAEGYANYVMELIGAKTRPLVWIEQRLDLSVFAEGSFGTADCIVIAEDELHVVDYKHGLGILVDSYENPQLQLYGLGALHLFDAIYDVERVVLHIYQPRRENISVFEISKEALYQWAEEVVIPTSKLAFNGDGSFRAGDWCHFCPIKNKCRERANATLKIAQSEFKQPALLSDEEIDAVLQKVDLIESWLKDMKAYAYARAMGGQKWTSVKLVEGRSNRKYTNEDAVAEVVQAAGFDPYEKKLKGITAMTKLLGKETFHELLANHIEKPKGKLTLAARSDKRPEVETINMEFKKETKKL